MKKILYLFIVLLFTSNNFAQLLPSKTEVIGKMRLVNDYWISQNANPGNNQWARAAYFTGNMDFYKIYPKDSYRQYASLWANNNGWGLSGGTATRNADNQIAGQVYIDLYNLDEVKQSSKIEAIKTSIDFMVNSTKSDDWWWVDALYMAMPVFARLGVLTNDDAYFNKMHDIFQNTKVTRGLYNTTEGLWYRDESFDPPYFTPNGQDSYWSRGNGWVMGALVRVLQLLPADNIHRPEYIETFQKMALSLKERQREDGCWNVSLDDPTDFGGPETSGTGFFTYGLAWGINNQLLDSASYFPVVVKAWNGLSTIAVQPTGFLGYVQGVGSNPSSSQPVTVGSTADFGVGAFLLAGTEVVKLADGVMPVPSDFAMTSIKVTDKTHIEILFSKKTDLTTALLVNNYTINNNVTVLDVTKGGNDSTIILTVEGLNYGLYQVQINNILSDDGSPVEAGEALTFAYTGIVAVTASDYQANTSNTPDKTIDFDFSTRWSSEGKGQWIQYDLGEPELVNSVDLAFYSGNIRKSYFIIQLSTDGTNFTEVLNDTSSGTTVDLENYDFVNQNARYIRIIGNGNSQSLWNSITETRINWSTLISGLNKNHQPQTDFTFYPNPLQGNELTIKTGTNSNGFNVNITDLTGRSVFSVNVQALENKITVPDLSLKKGAYILTVENKFSSKSKMLLVE